MSLVWTKQQEIKMLSNYAHHPQVVDSLTAYTCKVFMLKPLLLGLLINTLNILIHPRF